MKNDDKALSRVELELTQRMQMHFPWGRIPVGVLATWNGCPAGVLTEKLFEVFSKSWLVANESVEHIKARFAPFLTETFTKWYNKEIAEKVKQKPSLVAPKDINWEKLKNDIDEAKFGEYTLNPEMQGIDFESFPLAKVKVLALGEMIGKTLAEVGEHIVKKYGATHRIPGVEYWRYVIENPDKAPLSLKDGSYHYLFGSMLRNLDGDADVPCAYWGGDQFSRDAEWLVVGWDSLDRVVLLEK